MLSSTQHCAGKMFLSQVSVRSNTCLQNVFWPNVCCVTSMSLKCPLTKCQSQSNIVSAKCLLAKCLLGQKHVSNMSFGQMSRLIQHCIGQMSFGQSSLRLQACWQNVFWPNGWVDPTVCHQNVFCPKICFVTTFVQNETKVWWVTNMSAKRLSAKCISPKRRRTPTTMELKGGPVLQTFFTLTNCNNLAETSPLV
jgi:hypothetical protein